MTTLLYPISKKRIKNAIEQLIKKQIIPWSFLTAGPPFRIKKHDESLIAYQGVGFEGSPREVTSVFFETPFISGHMKIRYLHEVLPQSMLKFLNALFLKVPFVNKIASHQLLVSGRI